MCRLKATGGRKAHRKDNCVSRIQFSQGYSFEVARYSTVAHFQMLKSARSWSWQRKKQTNKKDQIHFKNKHFYSGPRTGNLLSTEPSEASEKLMIIQITGKRGGVLVSPARIFSTVSQKNNRLLAIAVCFYSSKLSHSKNWQEYFRKLFPQPRI